METTISIPFDSLGVLPEEVSRRMGYGEAEPDELTGALLKRLFEEAHERVRPSFYYRILPCRILAESVEVESVCFRTEKMLARLLRHSEKIAVFAATAGAGFQHWAEEVAAANDPLELYVLDALGSCIAESAGDYLEQQLESELSDHLHHTNRFSPGYCHWPVVEQQKLFGLLPPGVCGIRLNESSLMIPVKSISGVIGIGRQVVTKTYGCGICGDKNCYLRNQKRTASERTQAE